jgi:hypothetical protein
LQPLIDKYKLTLIDPRHELQEMIKHAFPEPVDDKKKKKKEEESTIELNEKQLWFADKAKSSLETHSE